MNDYILIPNNQEQKFYYSTNDTINVGDIICINGLDFKYYKVEEKIFQCGVPKNSNYSNKTNSDKIEIYEDGCVILKIDVICDYYE